MGISSEASPTQLGLLDLSVDLSVPEVYAGSDFTLYLHVNNPFGQRLWIRSVELSLPTQLTWRPSTDESKKEQPSEAERKIESRIVKRAQEISDIEKILKQLPADNPRFDDLQSQLDDLIVAQRADGDELLVLRGGVSVDTFGGASLVLDSPVVTSMRVSAYGDSKVTIKNMTAGLHPERVPLQGSLPKGAALESGSTDVWTIRLGSGRSPFFLPAQYRLQITVIYSLSPPNETAGETQAPSSPTFSNTTAVIVPVKAALWSIILGGLVGGGLGSVGRSLQNVATIDALPDHFGASVSSLMLSLILSGAAVIFSARKSDTQTFVTVEDFWGGVLIGFLVGYSGTAAFTEFAKVDEASTQALNML